MSTTANIAWVDDVEGAFAFSETWAKFTELAGLVIESISEDDAGMAIRFTDGSRICIFDDGQSCCESRYVTCDDDLTGLAGGSLLHIDKAAVGDAPEVKEDDYGCHDVAFVRVQTTKGGFTLVTHNEHNGYYGGFSLKVKLVR